MMVRYARERGFKGQGCDPLLTLGRIYLVMGVVIRPAPYQVQVCILTDTDPGDHRDGKPYSDGGPGLFDMNFFDIADVDVPPDWSMIDQGKGYYTLSPKEFGGDFWDRFHDGDSRAETTFEQVLKRLEVFHSGENPSDHCDHV
ncbi:hypothetical protein P9239_05760 [Caballeronia sp. LZ062]|uniref:hypothetical protein n=1 Tax=unclassified Caballeronia TaxID=2646786 RepID=UPI0028593839|nr:MULTISPECIES: hypothetical protein [unclassified Caballeronia]MDR5856737.1 hypothetical protein [Caballeronia sp. LZ050]MDR5869866.1 hypothetical protein [Caballeronia sp. LZ062]